jgi:hypothetical protein
MAGVQYGSDLAAIDDLFDPELEVDGDLNVAYALARRMLTPAGAMEEIGDTAPYDSIDIRDWLGKRFDLNDRTVLDELQIQCHQVISQDRRVSRVSVVATFTQGTLAVSVQAEGAEGPFSFVLSVDGVTVTFLRGGA